MTLSNPYTVQTRCRQSVKERHKDAGITGVIHLDNKIKSRAEK